MFSVPVMGMSCIFCCRTLVHLNQSYRPREGYELHLTILKLLKKIVCSYRPREGYELHPKLATFVLLQSKEVIVPVRGMSCIGKSKQT